MADDSMPPWLQRFVDLAELADDAEELGDAFAGSREMLNAADDEKLTTLVLAAERSQLQDLQARHDLVSAVAFLRRGLDRALPDSPVAASKSVYKKSLDELTSALRREASTLVRQRTEREQRLAMMARFYHLARHRPEMAFSQRGLCHDFGVDGRVTDRWVDWALGEALVTVADVADRGDRLLKITTSGINWVESALEGAGIENNKNSLIQFVFPHGEIHMGDKYTTNISGSTVGAIATGDHATATGYVTMGATGTVTQEQHKAAIKEAQTALVHDQDTLEQIDERLYEALGQFLRLARQIQVEQQSLAEVQAKMKETLDEVWAQQVTNGLRPQALPEGLKVVEALAKSPVTAEVAKALLKP